MYSNHQHLQLFEVSLKQNKHIPRMAQQATRANMTTATKTSKNHRIIASLHQEFLLLQGSSSYTILGRSRKILIFKKCASRVERLVPTSLFHQKSLNIWSTTGFKKCPSWEKDTLPKTNSLPLKRGLPNRKVVFQPSIFTGYVSFREAM